MVNLKKYPWWFWAVMLLSITALTFSLVMSWKVVSGGFLPGCGTGKPCDELMSSHWSTIFGFLPVSALAAGVYLALAFSLIFTLPENELSLRKLSSGVLDVLSGVITGSAVWFILVQIFITRSFCTYCMVVHIIGLVVSVIVVFFISVESVKTSKVRLLNKMLLFCAGLLMASSLAFYQYSTRFSGKYSVGKSEIEMPEFNYSTVPVIGLPDVENVVVLLFDYQCTHCQKIHFMINEIVRSNPDKIAFVLCPTPLNSKCNEFVVKDVKAFANSCELAKIGLAVWLADSLKFAEFEEWMFTFDIGDKWQPRDVESARNMAVDLVGEKKFMDAFSNKWINEFLQTCIKIYGKTSSNGNGGIPKLIYGSNWVIPQPQNSEDFISILYNSFGISGLGYK